MTCTFWNDQPRSDVTKYDNNNTDDGGGVDDDNNDAATADDEYDTIIEGVNSFECHSTFWTVLPPLDP